MHEMAIAQGVLDIALESISMYNATRVLRLRLNIGELTAVETEALALGFAELANGTAAEGAELDIVLVPLVGHCERCGCSFKIQGYYFRCSACGASDLELLSGRELQVEYLEVQ
jgi:hydrogenase nickel incorporation protein HypA/HybF